MDGANQELRVTPIGVARTPYTEPSAAPRQPAAGRSVPGTIELYPGRGFEFALSDLDTWKHIWVLFWFHRAEGWRAKVRPPRSRRRRGVFATRSPHRPNPIGMSAVELERVDGLTLHVRGLDVLDGTPVIDLKPYVAYTDALPDDGGWLASEARADPGPRWGVALSELATEQAAHLRDQWSIELELPIVRALSLGPAPHPYRRIKREGDALRLAYKDWRATFSVAGDAVTVHALATGYRARELYSAGGDAALAAHRDFVEKWGYPGDGAIRVG